MPEMPEVETIARRLRRSLVGKRIAEVDLSGLPLRKPVEDSFRLQLPGRSIRGVRRRGKYLVIELEPPLFWLIHLGMSGRICFGSTTGQVEKHTQAVIRFSDASELHYNDHRRFGLLAVYEVHDLRQIPEIRRLGVDPLNRRFQAAWLLQQLARCRQEIKSFLLDQQKIAGLGNIYVCEALYRARIHPARRCYTLTLAEAGRLVRAIQKVLRIAIRHRGTSFSDFMDSDGQAGENQRYLRVFQREGKRCARCRTEILRLRQGNRSSFFCPLCQLTNDE